MQKPEPERLEHALYLLDQITGHVPQMVVWLSRNWRLTATEIRVFGVLNAVAPLGLTRMAILSAAWDDPDSVEIKGVDVIICKLRAKIPLPIKTIWGQGWRLTTRFKLPEEAS